MTQPVPLVSDDDDEPTQSYTHSQLETMRSGFREPDVRPEDFENFGNSGTPEGVIGSRNEPCLQIVGTIGESCVEQIGSPRVAANQAPAPANSGLWGEPPELEELVEGQEVAELRSWPPAQASPAAAAAADSEEVTELEDDASDSSDGESKLGSKRLWLLIAGPLALFGVLVLVFSLMRGGYEEPVVAAAPEPIEEVEEVEEVDEVEAPPPLEVVQVISEELDDELVAVPQVPSPPAPKAWQGKDCRNKRDAAETARSSGKWKTVRQLTEENKRCWKRDIKRRVILCKALFELKEYPECIRVAGKSSNSELVTARKRCQLRNK